MDLQALHDKIEIQELLARYARGVDSKDWELWKSVFTPDATVDYSSAGAAVGSRDEVAAWLEQGLERRADDAALHHATSRSTSTATGPRCGPCSTTRCSCPGWPT